jgi:hypothetical protein
MNGQAQRMVTATAMAACTIIRVEKPDMVRQRHARPGFADRFFTHMVTRHIPDDIIATPRAVHNPSLLKCARMTS